MFSWVNVTAAEYCLILDLSNWSRPARYQFLGRKPLVGIRLVSTVFGAARLLQADSELPGSGMRAGRPL